MSGEYLSFHFFQINWAAAQSLQIPLVGNHCSNPICSPNSIILCYLFSCSFSEFPLHLWVVADRADPTQWCHCPALPALYQPHIWCGVAPDHTSDCCGDSVQTAVASLCCCSQDSEWNSDGLWRTTLLCWGGNCGRGRWRPRQRKELVSCCQLPLLPVSVGRRRPQCQVAVEPWGSVGCCLFAHNQLPHQVFAQPVQPHVQHCESLLGHGLPLPPAPPDHKHRPAQTTLGPYTDGRDGKGEIGSWHWRWQLLARPRPGAACTLRACEPWDVGFNGSTACWPRENREQLHCSQSVFLEQLTDVGASPWRLCPNFPWVFVCRTGAGKDKDRYTSDIYRGEPCVLTVQEPVWVATVGFSLPGGERNDRVCECAFHLCAASKPQREHCSDQIYRDSAGAVYQIFNFICSKHKQHIDLNTCIKPDWWEAKVDADWRLFATGSPD